MTLYNQDMYGWDNVENEIQLYENLATYTYWHGNFAGTMRVAIHSQTDRIPKGAGTTKYDVTPYIKNDGTYIRFYVKGSGYTTALIHGAIKLFFADAWDGTIQQAIDTGRIDPIAFRHSGSNNTRYRGYTNLTTIFSGGNSDSQSYANACYLIRPIEGNVLTHFEFYTNKALDATYDGFLVAQTNVSRIGTSEEAVLPDDYVSSGTYLPPPIPTESLPPTPRIRYTADTPEDTAITVEYACTDDDETPPETWMSVDDEDLLTIDDAYLWLRYTLETEDTSKTPTLLAVWLEEAEAPPGTILLTMTPDSRFNDAEGDLTVTYTQALGTLAGTRPVEDFTESFTPTDLEPTPIDRHDITAGIEVEVDFIKVDYRYFKDDSADHIITAGITVEVDLIPVSEIPP